MRQKMMFKVNGFLSRCVCICAYEKHFEIDDELEASRLVSDELSAGNEGKFGERMKPVATGLRLRSFR